MVKYKTTKPELTTRQKVLALCLFPLPFVLLGLSVIIFGFYTIHMANASSRWPVAKGKVTSSKVKCNGNSDGDTYCAEICYDFTVDEEVYSGDGVYGWWYGDSNSDVPRTVRMKYPVGKEVDVHYNPDNPETCFLELGVNGPLYYVVLVGAVFFAFGVGFAMFFLSRMGRDDDGPKIRVRRRPLFPRIKRSKTAGD